MRIVSIVVAAVVAGFLVVASMGSAARAGEAFHGASPANDHDAGHRASANDHDAGHRASANAD